MAMTTPPVPPGFFSNNDDAYSQVAGSDILPLDKIVKLWRVYSLTHRKVGDQRTRRLENFWWHVWGSDRRKLSGKRLARLFEDISRHEYSLPPRRSAQDENSSDHEKPGSDQGEPLSLVLSSSSKPPPKQSILKKPRAPSKSSGPRQKARFEGSPTVPGTQDANDSGASSGSATAVATASNQSSSASLGKAEKKSTSQTTKKFIASTSASKLRPQVTRRTSSQNSVSSDTGNRDGPSSASTARSQGSSGSSQSERPTLSAKSAGKRPLRPVVNQVQVVTGGPTAARGGEPVAQRNVAQQNPAAGETREVTPEYELSPATGRAQSHVPTGNGVRRGSAQRSPLTLGTSASVATQGTTTANLAQPQRSPRRRETADGRLPSQGLVASSVAGTSRVAVQGTFDFEDPAAMLTSGSEARDLPDSVALPSRPSAASLRDMMFTPTAPSSTPAVPLGRSKSQLTLLLEREKEKLGGDLPSPRRRKTSSGNGNPEK